MTRGIVADVLLALAVLTVAASATGLLVMPSAYARLHVIAPSSVVAPVLVWLAIFVREGLDSSTGQMLIALVFMLAASPFLAHATIRAIRVREQGDWRQQAHAQQADAQAADAQPAEDRSREHAKEPR